MEFVNRYDNGRGQKVGSKDEGLFCHHSCHSNSGDEVTNTRFDHFFVAESEEIV
jgi:hypothetical protein